MDEGNNLLERHELPFRIDCIIQENSQCGHTTLRKKGSLSHKLVLSGMGDRVVSPHLWIAEALASTGGECALGEYVQQAGKSLDMQAVLASRCGLYRFVF